MKTSDSLTPLESTTSAESSWLEQKAINALQRHLQGCVGQLRVILPSQRQITLGQGSFVTEVKLYNFTPLLRILFGGINGWSEGYLKKEWDCSDLTALVRWGLQNESALNSASRFRFVTQKLHNLYHKQRDNSRKGSKRNIAAHYDLGNAFYKHWLDPSMTYSSALYFRDSDSLSTAQHQKYAAILERLQAKPGDHIAEIGCGWGAFATQAASEHDLRVHGVTLSHEQLSWAKNRISEQQLDDQVHLSLTDYRDLNNQYDGIVSIEMFEAVGEAHWDTYFETLKKISKPGGRIVLQIITIEDERFLSYRKQADFIQRYVFPGGMLPSVEALKKKFAQHGLTLQDQFMFGKDYARTLREWRYDFEHNWQEIAAEGFDEYFRRLWRYYLTYCEGGFESGAIDVGLFTLTTEQ